MTRQLDKVATNHKVNTSLEAYRDGVVEAVSSLPLDTLQQIIDLLREARQRQSRVFIIGNGGSAATASHMVCDLSKSTIRSDAPRMRVVALVDNTPLVTAWANDSSYENIFVEQVENLAQKGDVLIAISGSGNSENVLRAVRLARELGVTTVGLTGFAGGKLKGLVDLCVVIKSDVMGQIEDAHLVIGHMLAYSL